MAKKVVVFKKTVVGEGMAAVMTWAAVDGSRTVVCDSAKIPEPTRGALYVHGMNAKVGDAGALKEGSTVAEKADAMQKVVDALYAGTWRGERESGDAMLLEAICEFSPKKSRDAHAAELKSLSSAEKLTLRTQIPALKKIYDRMAAEAVKKSGASAADLLAKFSMEE